jgi:hypothetical protein
MGTNPCQLSLWFFNLIISVLRKSKKRFFHFGLGGEWKSLTSILPQKKNYNERTVRNAQFFAGSFMKPTGSLSF